MQRDNNFQNVDSNRTINKRNDHHYHYDYCLAAFLVVATMLTKHSTSTVN